MDVKTIDLTSEEVAEVIAIEETHFVDVKSGKIAPAKLTKTISAFANTSGGDIYIGIEEFDDLEGSGRAWDGYENQEAANSVFQVIDGLNPLGNNYSAEFLKASGHTGLVLHLIIFKTQDVVFASDGKAYVRRNAQSLPIASEAAMERLRYDKGVKSFEDELVNTGVNEITTSDTIQEFMSHTIPTAQPSEWLSKQRIILEGRPTVAGVLLYSDLPQALLPKRSAIKILRYMTKKDAERDFLAFSPMTIEGPIYNLIFSAVDKIKSVIESIEKAGPGGMEKIEYPEEAVHEILTNAVLHRDYNVAADVQVRIFDNRVEIESPGRLPGHVTVQNITKTQFARNPKLIRLVNKFPDPPNKDVGEGLNTAFEAMGKLRLKPPVIEEGEGTVVVTLNHESLASPEQVVLEYLTREPEITNSIARELTGIKSENSMKQVFYKLRDTGQLEQTPKVKGKKPSWRRPQSGSGAAGDGSSEGE